MFLGLQRDAQGNRWPLEQFTPLPHNMNVQEISRRFAVPSLTYLNFLRTYDQFAATGRLFAKSLKHPKYLTGTHVPIPCGHPDFDKLNDPEGSRTAADLLDSGEAVTAPAPARPSTSRPTSNP